jgi:hypothetical protein
MASWKTVVASRFISPTAAVIFILFVQINLGYIDVILIVNFFDPENAIRREKRLKKYSRKWKLELIEKENSNWRDLYYDLIPGLPDSPDQACPLT